MTLDGISSGPVNEEQSLNALKQMLVTLELRMSFHVNSDLEKHWLQKLMGISTIPIVKSISTVPHCANASKPILVTLEGITREPVNPVHPENANVPIVVTVFGISNFPLRLTQFWYSLSLISVTPSSKSMWSPFGHCEKQTESKKENIFYFFLI